MENYKTLKYKKQTNNELVLLSAEVNAKGIGTFLEDFYQAWVSTISRNELSIPINPVIFSDDDEIVTISHRVDNSILAELRILAIKNGMTLKYYMESICEWLANEHRENGRVWFDDTPRRALPIRTRKV